jgi:hypothetical protein
MARAIAKIMAVSRRLPLGCQRQSLYLPRPRPKKSRWADARVSNELATTFEAEATLLNICDSTARFNVALLGKRAAATHTNPVALSIRPQLRACINGNLDRSRQQSNNLPEQLQTAFLSTKVSSVDVSRPTQETSAAWQCPRCRPRNSKR